MRAAWMRPAAIFVDNATGGLVLGLPITATNIERESASGLLRRKKRQTVTVK
jgi:hypothetical protein